MFVKEITVEVHEKRNHPHEFGHKDCSVSFSAMLEDEEDALDWVELLREKADQQVKAHLDTWIAEIQLERDIESIESHIRLRFNWPGNEKELGERYENTIQRIDALPLGAVRVPAWRCTQLKAKATAVRDETLLALRAESDAAGELSDYIEDDDLDLSYEEATGETL